MAFIPVPDAIQVELVYLWNGQRCQNVLHYMTVGAPTVEQMEAVAQFFVDWFGTTMDLLTVNTCSLVEIRVFDMATENAPGITYASGLPLLGAITSSATMPNSVTVSVTKRTALRGRSFRGRVYQVGLTEGMVEGNNVIPAQVAAITAAWNTVKDITDGTEVFTLGVVSRFSGGQPRTQGIITEVQSFTCDGVIDSQRRRLPGRGN